MVLYLESHVLRPQLPLGKRLGIERAVPLVTPTPLTGLGPQMVESVYELLVQIAAEGTAVLLVEQNVTLAFEITNRAYVLQQGRLVLSGPSRELADDQRVISAYLGARLEPTE